jgi:hypothetical protein
MQAKRHLSAYQENTISAPGINSLLLVLLNGPDAERLERFCPFWRSLSHSLFLLIKILMDFSEEVPTLEFVY